MMHVWRTIQQFLPLLQSGRLSEHEQPAVASWTAPVAFSRAWQVLGPWSIGTREAPWGADPLEFHGGFRNLRYDPDAWYPGSLESGGNVAWSTFNAKEYSANAAGSVSALEIHFGEVDWQSHQQVYGWTGLQWQAWARGFIEVASEVQESVLLYTENVLEFYVDGEPYFGGDLYAFRKAPAVLRLEPGRHQLDIRLIRDVRAMGATGLPKLDIRLELVRTVEPLEEGEDRILMPDVLHGRVASRHGSLSLRNNAEETIHVTKLRSANDDFLISRYGLGPVILAPGQTKPVAFLAEMRNPAARNLDLVIEYQMAHDPAFVFIKELTHKLKHAATGEPHRVTFLHPSGSVSYAMLRPPAANATCSSKVKKAPVFLVLHGAGVEASWPIATHALDAVADLCAWVLFPTGTTPWSGDDWHTWGLADVEAAVEHVPSWIERHRWNGVGVDTQRWIVAGHSNGGQGTWYLLTHRPDQVLAASVVSGYSSIQNYVPYTMWSFADPLQTAVVQASLNDFRHELLAANVHGIPLLQQHGSSDDNVPVYHARLMQERLYLDGTESAYFEILGAGHWFDGVMTTRPLQTFYRLQANSSDDRPASLKPFSMVVANPASTGPKNGVHVVHLLDPGQYGRVDFVLNSDGTTCEFTTKNAYAFSLAPLYDTCHRVVIDGQAFAPGASLFEWHDAWWGYLRDEELQSTALQRSRKQRQMGGINALLRTIGAFKITYDAKVSFDIALQVSRNLHQYYGADSDIVHSEAGTFDQDTGHIIALRLGLKLGLPYNASDPLRWNERGELAVRRPGGRWHVYKDAVAAIFIRPRQGEKAEVVVWGRDVEKQGLAARLLPTLTGVGQPDFVLLSDACRWKGIGGVLAMGFFDHEWNVTRSSWFS